MDISKLTKRLRRPLKVDGVVKTMASRSLEFGGKSAGSAVDCKTRKNDLMDSLMEAIRIEFFTIPPYLTAAWSIIDHTSDVYKTLMGIAVEEMYHFAFACNMFVAISNDRLEVKDFQPSYPNKLPGGARPHLVVSLRQCDKMQVEVFADVESFDSGGGVDTIGEFYAALQDSFLQYILECKPTLNTDRQVDYSPVFKIQTKDDVERAIGVVSRQGEGIPKDGDPTDPTDGGLAHYFQFKELEYGVRYRNIDGKWRFDHSDPVSLPPCYDMADIPEAGYDTSSMPVDAQDLLVKFRDAYKSVLSALTDVWNNNGSMDDAIYPFMQNMTKHARALMTKDIGGGLGKYGPDFKV